MSPITITPAHLARHTPTGAGSQGRDAALVDIAHGYAFLRDLDDDERVIATCRGQDRPLALRMLQDLPGQRLHDVGLY